MAKKKKKVKKQKDRQAAHSAPISGEDFIAACVSLNEVGKQVAKGLKGVIEALDEVADAIRDSSTGTLLTPLTKADLEVADDADDVDVLDDEAAEI